MSNVNVIRKDSIETLHNEYKNRILNCLLEEINNSIERTIVKKKSPSIGFTLEQFHYVIGGMLYEKLTTAGWEVTVTFYSTEHKTQQVKPEDVNAVFKMAMENIESTKIFIKIS